jgi:RHS repeat-associated protein
VKDGVVTKYISSANMKIAQIKGTETSYYHRDHLGSSAVMTNAAGVKVEATEYAPYGTIREHTGTAVTDYRYTGKELDTATNLYYYGARYYDPMIGRFVTPDPILAAYIQNGGVFEPVNLNLYHYAANNPLIYVDPNGLLSTITIPGLFKDGHGDYAQRAIDMRGGVNSDFASGFLRAVHDADKYQGAGYQYLHCGLETDQSEIATFQVISNNMQEGLQKAQNYLANSNDYHAGYATGMVAHTIVDCMVRLPGHGMTYLSPGLTPLIKHVADPRDRLGPEPGSNLDKQMLGANQGVLGAVLDNQSYSFTINTGNSTYTFNIGNSSDLSNPYTGLGCDPTSGYTGGESD